MFFWLDDIPLLLLMFVRLSVFFIVAPIFSMRGVPGQFKVGFAFFCTILAFFVVSDNETIVIDSSYFVMIIKEALIGMALGFVAALILYAVQMAGAFIDFQMGFAIANVVDPQTGMQVPIIGNFKYMLAILFLLSMNGHHLMLQGVLKSYELIPAQQLFVPIGSEQMARFISSTFVDMFLIAFQLAIPIVGALFLVDVALGILARTVPQVNVFVVGLPLKIFTGFVLLLITMSSFFYLLNKVLTKMIETMGELVALLGG